MASVIEMQGGQAQKPTRYTPIFTNRFFSGMWTQRNPLRDAGSSRAEERFYGGRGDGLIDGSNVEVTTRLTVARRPGTSVYNGQSFSAIDQFYSFRLEDGETIFVMADASDAVYEATGPSNKNLLGTGIPNGPWKKQADGGQVSFQSVLDVLYMSDNSQVPHPWGGSADQWKWVKSPKKWLPHTEYFPGDFIEAPNGYLQRVGRAIDGIASASGILGPNLAGNGINTGKLKTFSLNNGGQGYAIGDTGFINANSKDATYVVDSVAGSVANNPTLRYAERSGHSGFATLGPFTDSHTFNFGGNHPSIGDFLTVTVVYQEFDGIDVGSHEATTRTVSDNQGNTWTEVAHTFLPNSNPAVPGVGITQWICLSSKTAVAPNISVTLDGVHNGPSHDEYSAISYQFDAISGFTATSVRVSSASAISTVTTTPNLSINSSFGDFVYVSFDSAFAAPASATPTAGYTVGNAYSDSSSGWKNIDEFKKTTGIENPSITSNTSSEWLVAGFAIKPSLGGAVVTFHMTNNGTEYQTGTNLPTTNSGSQPGTGEGFTIDIASVDGVAWQNPQNVSSQTAQATVTTSSYTNARVQVPTVFFDTLHPSTTVTFPGVGGVGIPICWQFVGYFNNIYSARTRGDINPTGITNNYVVFKTFPNPSVPGNATINGLSVRFGSFFTAGGGTNDVITDVALFYNGSVLGTSKQPNFTITNGITKLTFGAIGDLWGASLTPAIVNDPSFGLGVKVKFLGGRSFINVDDKNDTDDKMTLTVYYSIGSTATSQHLEATQFGFSTTNNPVGIIVTFDGSLTNASPDASLVVQLILNGVPIGDSKSTLPGSTLSNISLGANDDLWSTALTAADISNSSFGVQFSTSGGGTFAVGNVQITIQTSLGKFISGGNVAADEPNFSTQWGGITLDGTPPTQITWICNGPNLQKFAISPPVNAPTVTKVPVLGSAVFNGQQWAANTWYLPNLTILDSQATPHVQKINTNGGTTGGLQPVWGNPTTVDNTITWTDLGSSVWTSSTSYSVGKVVSVTYTFSGIVHTDFFSCTRGGTSSSGAIGTVPWQAGIGSITTETSGIQWTNKGPSITWAGIGAGQTISGNTIIVDTNGNQEEATTSGKTGAAAFQWPLASGSTTFDNTETWINIGPISIGAATSATSGASASLVWKYCYTWRNSLTGDESTASPFSSTIKPGINQGVLVSGVFSPDMQVDTIRIYRTVLGGAIPFLLVELEQTALSGTWSYTDTKTDDQLNDLIPGPIDHVNDPPPMGLINMAYHLGRIFGSVGNIVFYSDGPATNPGNPNSAFDPLNFFIYPSRVQRLVPTNMGLYVFTTSDVYIISGQGTGALPFYSVPYILGLGLDSFNELDVNGALIYLRTADNQIMEIQPGTGMSEIGFPIGDQFSTLTTGTGNGFPQGQGYLTWHVDGSTDKAVYVSNGSDGWFRFSPTASPEGGFHWSPKATLSVSSGIKAVQSIEVLPGKHRLLIGPSGTGPILQRDITLYSPQLGFEGAPILFDNVNGEVILAGQESVVASAGVANLALTILINSAVLVFVADANNEAITVTDDGGNVYTQLGDEVLINFGTSVPIGTQYFRLFVTNPSKTVGATTVTVTSPTPQELKILAAVYTNVSGYGKHGSSTGISAFPSITIQRSNEKSLIVAGFNWEPGVFGVETTSGDTGITIGL